MYIIHRYLEKVKLLQEERVETSASSSSSARGHFLSPPQCERALALSSH